jgi:hypothetical protein
MKNIQNELPDIKHEGKSPAQAHEFEYLKYVPYNIAKTYNKALYYYNINIDSSLYYLSVCLKNNDCPLVNLFIGDILYQKQDRRVLFFYDKAYDGYNKDPGFLVRLCVANLVNKNRSQAKAILDELIELDPSYREIPTLKAALNN